MSIFGNILGAIFGHAGQSKSQQPPPGGEPSKTAAPSQGGKTSVPPRPAVPQQPVDVSAVLEKLKTENKANLDWQHSIVDLMKLLDLDSSLSARKELATELHYTGDMHDSASMNIWLHKQVMTKLAENGGKVPASLKD